MASFLMDDGTMIDTARATQVWHNTPDEDGIPPTCTHLYRHATGTYDRTRLHGQASGVDGHGPGTDVDVYLYD